jgi:hypothetical protein
MRRVFTPHQEATGYPCRNPGNETRIVPPSTMAPHFVLASSFLCDDDDDDDATGAAYRNPRPLRFRRDLCIRARMLGPNGDFVPATSARAAAKFAGAGRPRSHFVPIDPPRKL